MEKEKTYLMDIQKKKEMKEIGIDYVGSTKKGMNGKKKDGMNYNNEVPFFRDAPKGPFGIEKERKPPKMPSFLGKEMK